ncbi:lysoplasmalogenase [Streptomyces sp. LRE541]|uniref:lysoplasmalogenase n=1 Tax=Streptomyces sp. LRE541 TaxID=2931983 RepID=UPI00201077A6|nr:lysoplasmalogenase [Streptomyces sp. LRE541]UPZ32060.1 lysoplasmalogenase [Streptomyces sp. LRE541]
MTPRHARVPLVCFGLAGVVDLVSLAVGHDIGDAGHTVAKPLLMPLLALYAHLCGGPRLLVGALLLGWGGDVLLLLDAEPAFLAGMASFAAGHMCYLLLFARLGANTASRARGGRLRAAVYALAPVSTVTLLRPGLPAGLRVPVAGYSLLLTAMAYGAARLGPLAAAGGALFLLSDTLIATGVADWPQPPRPDLWIMLTYIAAQYLLVTGVLRAPGARPGPPATYRGNRTVTT